MMALTPVSDAVRLKLEYRDDCLIIHVHGRGILERTAAAMQELAAAIRTKPARLTLIDLRQVPGPVSFLERHQVGALAGRYLPRVPLAALLRDDQADPRRIGQLAARNRGVDVEVFTDPAAAEAWLKTKSRPGPKSAAS